MAKKKQFDDMPGKPIDVLLATNMVSVGVDVKRLGLMVVAGQPKTTAEYIQATSRVGPQPSRAWSCTVFNWARPRDLSHYETFEHYHATFYKHVEALSVTPFSPGALSGAWRGCWWPASGCGASSSTPTTRRCSRPPTRQPPVRQGRQSRDRQAGRTRGRGTRVSELQCGPS